MQDTCTLRVDIDKNNRLKLLDDLGREIYGIKQLDVGVEYDDVSVVKPVIMLCTNEDNTVCMNGKVK